MSKFPIHLRLERLEDWALPNTLVNLATAATLDNVCGDISAISSCRSVDLSKNLDNAQTSHYVMPEALADCGHLAPRDEPSLRQAQPEPQPTATIASSYPLAFEYEIDFSIYDLPQTHTNSLEPTGNSNTSPATSLPRESDAAVPQFVSKAHQPTNEDSPTPTNISNPPSAESSLATDEAAPIESPVPVAKQTPAPQATPAADESPIATNRASIRSRLGNATIELNAHGGRLQNTFSALPPPDRPENLSLPYGLIGFEVADIERGGNAVVELTLPGGNFDGYYKQDPHTNDLNRFSFDGETGAIVRGNTVTLYLRDGGRGDDDGLANGVIVDPGGPGSTDNPLIFSQVYGAGGVTGATCNQDFIELFNRSSSVVTLTGQSVQYADAESGDWQVIPLSGTLASGHYYLIGGASGANGANLPTPDATTSVNFDMAAGKVALVESLTPLFGAIPSYVDDVRDLVGYGETADWFEGSAAAQATAAEAANLRLDHGNYDSNDNSYDFSSDTPDARNSSNSTANLSPAIAMPADLVAALNTTITVAGVSVTDVDAGGSDLEFSVSAFAGTVSLSGTAGLTFSAGDGTADESMTFTGTLAAANAALNNLTYTPTTGHRGSAFVTVTADDLGHTGYGGALFDTESTYIVVDGPVVAIDDEQIATEDTPLMLTFLNNDAWIDYPTVTILTGPAHGLVEQDPETEEWIYTPNAEYHGTDSFTYELDDGFSNADSASVAIAIESVDDAFIYTTGEKMISEEGEEESTRFETPNATVDLTWSATGLPVGLSIDENTGIISGRPQYDQAGNHPISLTATADTANDEYTAVFDWLVRDTNRWNWVDDAYQQAGQVPSVFLAASDLVGNALTYEFAGLPPGVEYNGWSNFTGQLTTAGSYNVNAYVTGGGATDERTFIWNVRPAPVIIPLGQTPTPGYAAFATNGTFIHSDDVANVGTHTTINLKLFTEQLDYQNTENNGGPFILQVLSGDASVTQDANDPVGWDWITLQNVAGFPMAVASAYLIGHSPSFVADGVVLGVFRWINGVLTQMVSNQGKAADVVKFKIGTGLLPGGAPDHLNRDGIISAKTTPAAMDTAGAYRIPPRNWGATDLWVWKDGVMAGTKKLYLVAPRAIGGFLNSAGQSIGQSDDHGRVAMTKYIGDFDGERWVELEEADFENDVAQVWIRGHLEANPTTVYQTKVGNAKRLFLGLFNTTDDTSAAKLGQVYTSTYRFSVAAIPSGVTLSIATAGGIHRVFRYSNPPLNTTGDWRFTIGTYYFVILESDSGPTSRSDLDEIRFGEQIFAKNQKGLLSGALVSGSNQFIYNGDRPVGKSDPVRDLHGVRRRGTIPGNLPTDPVSVWGPTQTQWIQTIIQDLDNAGPLAKHEMEKEQYWAFEDRRTGTSAGQLGIPANGVPIRYSGFYYFMDYVQKTWITPYALRVRVESRDYAAIGTPPVSVKGGYLAPGTGGDKYSWLQ